jgi:hypothetical protein
MSKRIDMGSKGCTPEILYNLYYIQKKTQEEIKEIFNIKADRVLNRWFEESGIKKRERGKYTFNKNFFDEIDTENKAYWLGFVWCDGYVCKRKRNTRISYEFKLSLSEKDEDHLEKFKKDINSSHPIRKYEPKEYSFLSKHKEARLLIANNYFGSVLYNKYKMIPNRFEIDELIKHVPNNLINHFIRGVFDAEGSLSEYYIKEDRLNQLTYKIKLSFYTYENLLIFIRQHFLEKGLIKYPAQLRKRHEERDGHACGLTFSGNKQVPKILDYIYKDATVFLDRKKKIYDSIKNKLN